MQLVVHETLCSGCRACEVACVGNHEGRFGTATSRIRVRKVEQRGIQNPAVCRSCPDAPCVAACPTSALSRDTATRAVLLSADDCIICPACADACTHDGVFFLRSGEAPLICDMCGGDPACVRRCVTGAIEVSRE